VAALHLAVSRGRVYWELRVVSKAKKAKAYVGFTGTSPRVALGLDETSWALDAKTGLSLRRCSQSPTQRFLSTHLLVERDCKVRGTGAKPRWRAHAWLRCCE
jgi:hypothetical protein